MKLRKLTSNAIAAALMLAFTIATGCTSDDEKPKPDFMSEPAASSQAPGTKTDATDSAAPNSEVAIETPAASPTNRPAAQSRPDDDSREPTIVIVEGPGNGNLDSGGEAALDDTRDPGTEYDDDFAVDDSDEEDEEDEEPREEDGSFFYGGTRPFIPPPLDASPSPENIDVAAPPMPSASQLEPPTAPWEPIPRSELERILAREETSPTGEKVYPSDEELRALDRYSEIPTPDDPNPADHP